jgi:FkbM family methyltransferase
MYSLDNLDEKIEERMKRIGVKSKFYIEAGANDGITQSNTAMFEFHRGWTGILVEPNFENYQKATQNRPKSKVVHGALVSKDYRHETIKGIFSATSVNRWNGLCTGVTEAHLKEFPDQVCEVPAITLTKILQDCNAPLDIGFFSLDVENYELEVLRGLDTEVWRPHIIMLEVAKWDVEGVLEEHISYMKSIGYIPDQDFGISVHDFVFIDSMKQ